MRHRGCWRSRRDNNQFIAGSITKGRPVPGVALTPGKQVVHGNLGLYASRKMFVFLYAKCSDQRREDGFACLGLFGKYGYFLLHLWMVFTLFIIVHNSLFAMTFRGAFERMAIAVTI